MWLARGNSAGDRQLHSGERHCWRAISSPGSGGEVPGEFSEVTISRRGFQVFANFLNVRVSLGCARGTNISTRADSNIRTVMSFTYSPWGWVRAEYLFEWVACSNRLRPGLRSSSSNPLRSATVQALTPYLRAERQRPTPCATKLCRPLRDALEVCAALTTLARIRGREIAVSRGFLITHEPRFGSKRREGPKPSS
jgi:hypothetical protein